MPVSKPAIKDIITQLPRVPSRFKFRPITNIKIIAVHYDAQNVLPGENSIARYVNMAQFHIDKNWNVGPGGIPRLPAIPGFGLMYHYKINPAGEIFQTQPETLITWNASDANAIDLAICLDLGDNQQPTQAQLDSLEKMLDWLCLGRPDIPAGRANVFGHGELTSYGNSTKCPGNFRPFVKAYRNKVPKPPAGSSRRFDETGLAIREAFKTFFEANGDVPIFGIPLTAEMVQQLEDGKKHRVQWFERCRMEAHSNSVLLGRVGVEAFDAAHDTPPQMGAGVLPEFQAFYDAHGGVPIFGLPISGSMAEILEDGQAHIVQWFERARFELHGNNVVLGRVGAEAMSFLNNALRAAVI